jgi:hypothetical protein
VFDFTVGREFLLQHRDVFAEDEMLRIHDSGYRGENLVSNGLVDGAKIKERNGPENGGTGHEEPLAPRARRTFIVTFELFPGTPVSRLARIAASTCYCTFKQR